MKKNKIILVVVITILILGFSFSVKADGQELQGYVYSDTAGWISLNCQNTNSCNKIDYKVSEDGNGVLSGFGYSQNNEWINFNPNFGGASIDLVDGLSGYVFGQQNGWIKIENEKVVLATDMQNEIDLTKNTIAGNNLSDESAMSLLNSLCNKFLASSECNALSGQ
jgi:hypothetical protein